MLSSCWIVLISVRTEMSHINHQVVWIHFHLPFLLPFPSASPLPSSLLRLKDQDLSLPPSSLSSAVLSSTSAAEADGEDRDQFHASSQATLVPSKSPSQVSKSLALSKSPSQVSKSLALSKSPSRVKKSLGFSKMCFP